jgi:hypothetical protein
MGEAPCVSVKRNGDVFSGGRYAGRVTRTARTWAAERWVRGARPAHDLIGSGYGTRREAVDAILTPAGPCGLDECDCDSYAGES